MAEFKKALDVSQVNPGCGTVVDLDGSQIAIFNVGGSFYAIDNSCPHRGGPLGAGALHDKEVSCPWHGWDINVTTGEAFHNNAIKVKTYPVKVDGNNILISLGS